VAEQVGAVQADVILQVDDITDQAVAAVARRIGGDGRQRSAAIRCKWRGTGMCTLSQQFAETLTKLVASVQKRFRHQGCRRVRRAAHFSPERRRGCPRSGQRFRRNPPGAEILKAGGGLVSTRYAADEKWFAERQITAFNIATLTNPLSSPQGLTKVARMLADGTITARIHSTIQPDHIDEMREKLRNGSLHGKAVIRF
jgi:hypothetical protein